jgi:hypothetical protein
MSKPPTSPEMPFVNEMRLNARQWVLTGAIVLVIISLTPWVWKKVERFDTGPDYRIPYSLSKDYWLYERRARQLAPTNIVVLGDSVVWGEYVLPDGTLPHFLDAEAHQPGRFVNAGVNGMFPLALEGLVRHYGDAYSGRKILLQCNLLWLSSAKADLQTEKEEQFNHSRLVPQFSPRIPCYRAELSERFGAIAERNLGMIAWSSHLQNVYFEQKNILAWTLADDGGDPPRHPNVYKNPLSQIKLEIPTAAAADPERGPHSPRHRPWSTTGKGTTRFEWVTLESSLQWAAFQRLVELLGARGNEVFVVVGPFNEHFLEDENRIAYQRLRDGVAAWLEKRQVPHVVPAPLPSQLYADASHPLTEGYRLLAKQLAVNTVFQKWLEGK